MKKVFVVLILLVSHYFIMAQVAYQPKWESLDKRPVPQWFKDVKFGIFIHWGIYSVPAWGPTGDSIGVYDKYAEWYWYKLNENTAVQKYFKAFHQKTYGDKFKYQDFASQFKAELFNPDQWADLFLNSGARYVVLTSKHHEGFTLWPSAQSWNWNSVDIGPHRDLAGDLTKAVKAKGLHMGFYYSLYEWYNPLYKSDLNKYINDHMIPQMKDLINRYKPDVLWTDGEWEHTSKEWKSEEFLAWLYNESPVKETVAVNDRWGSECRSKHGGYYTTEYDLVGETKGIGEAAVHPWEECRGIGTSFGYNRNENLDSYSTSKALVDVLIEKVSGGGSLLLDIGPAADGAIPVIMQQRLLDMGEWLKVNGEAIYGTSQWLNSPKKKPDIYYTAKGKDLFVICTKFPENKITIENVKSPVNVSMLGFKGKVASEFKSGKLTIILPAINPANNPCNYAWVFKLENAL